MWYFAWVLGLGLAAAVGILNAMWFESRVGRAEWIDPAAPRSKP